MYVSRDGQTFGPFSWEELWAHFQAGSVLGTDLAWYEGQPEWRYVQQLFVPAPVVAPMPAPVTPVAQMAHAAIPAKPVGPLGYAAPVAMNPLADPSDLSTSGQATDEQSGADSKSQKPESKGKKAKSKLKFAKIRWQDIQLPGWAKYATPVAVFALCYILFGDENPPPPNRTEQVVGQAVRNEIGKSKGELEGSDYQNAVNLDLKSKGLTDLSELAQCTKVVRLDLSNNKITDLSPLEKLSNLEKLSLARNQITDFKSLEKITSLKEVVIEGNPGASKSVEDSLKRAVPGIKIVKKLSNSEESAD